MPWIDDMIPFCCFASLLCVRFSSTELNDCLMDGVCCVSTAFWCSIHMNKSYSSYAGRAGYSAKQIHHKAELRGLKPQ